MRYLALLPLLSFAAACSPRHCCPPNALGDADRWAARARGVATSFAPSLASEVRARFDMEQLQMCVVREDADTYSIGARYEGGRIDECAFASVLAASGALLATGTGSGMVHVVCGAGLQARGSFEPARIEVEVTDGERVAGQWVLPAASRPDGH